MDAHQDSRMATEPRVAVVLPTYNGRRYLTEQIESLLGQSHSEFLLLVRDDCSTDGTDELLAEFASRDSRIEILPNDGRRLGAKASFDTLLRAASARADYVFCSDQDDIWDTDKISATLDFAVQKIAGRPGMVFTDFRIIDERGTVVDARGPVRNVASRRQTFAVTSLLVSNYVWGCTSVCSRELLELALPIPADAENHDYWLAMTAAAMGDLHYLDQPTISYRKHSSNVTGGLEQRRFRSRLRRYSGLGLSESVTRRRLRDAQMSALRARLESVGSAPPRSLIELDRFLDSLTMRPTSRIMVEHRLNVAHAGFLQRFAHYVVLVAMHRARGGRAQGSVTQGS